jgi:hypothetical protein
MAKKTTRRPMPKVTRNMFIAHTQFVTVTVDGPSAVTTFIDDDGKLTVYVWRGCRQPSERQGAVLAYEGEPVAAGGERRADRS